MAGTWAVMNASSIGITASTFHCFRVAKATLTSSVVRTLVNFSLRPIPGAAAFTAALPDVVEEVEARLARWIASAAGVRVEDDGDRRVTARRRWTCALPEGTGEMSCGGTHLARLDELAAIDIRYAVTDDGSGMTVRTTPRRAT